MKGYPDCMRASFFPPLTLLFLCFQVDPYLPFEFTHEGMLERVSALIQNQVIKCFLFSRSYQVVVF